MMLYQLIIIYFMAININIYIFTLSGNLFINISNAYNIELENLGPISTYSINLSILSINIQDNDDLYASLNILTI